MTENKHIRILVAENDPGVLQTVAMMLRTSGYDVATASDGFEALLHFQDQVPDLLLSDLNMPAMSGFELLSVIRRRFPQVVAVATSGAYSSGSVPPGVIADAFYAKGREDAASLLEIIAEALRRGPIGHDKKTAQSGYRETERTTTARLLWCSLARCACGRSRSPSNTSRVRRYCRRPVSIVRTRFPTSLTFPVL